MQLDNVYTSELQGIDLHLKLLVMNGVNYKYSQLFKQSKLWFIIDKL